MVLTPSAPATFRADRPERSLISRRVAGDGSRDAFTSAKRASTASDSSDPVWSRFTNSDAIRRTKQSAETKSSFPTLDVWTLVPGQQRYI